MKLSDIKRGDILVAKHNDLGILAVYHTNGRIDFHTALWQCESFYERKCKNGVYSSGKYLLFPFGVYCSNYVFLDCMGRVYGRHKRII